MTTSRRPNVVTAWATADSICSRLHTSATVAVALGPSSCASAASGSRSRSTRTTRAPRATSRRAVSAPTPRAPPVMRTTWPLILLMNATVPSTAPDGAHDGRGELRQPVGRPPLRIAQHQLGALLAEADQQPREQLGVQA